MRRILLLVPTGLLVMLAMSSFAANWTFLGSSGFTTNPAFMQDYDRIILNCIAVDGAGNIFCTANNINNRGLAGGVTVFSPGGAKLRDINVNALGFPGGITKLVTAGDGKVYALQNWREAWAWGMYGTNHTEGIPEKLLRINLDGTVDKVYEALPVNDGWALQNLYDPLGSISVIDIPGEPGNKGLRMVHGTKGGLTQYYRACKDPACTISARFYVSAFSYDSSPANVLQLNAGGCDSTPAVGIAIRSDNHFWLVHYGSAPIQDLGPVVLGAMNEAYLYVDGPASQVKLKWNGTEHSFVVTDPSKLWSGPDGWPWGYGMGYPEFGGSTDGGRGGTTTAVFDWVGYGRGYITSPTSANYVSLADGTITDLQYKNAINGMDVGPDGYVYFDVGSIKSPWKDAGNWFWRYKLGANPPEVSAVGRGRAVPDIFNNLVYTSDNYFAALTDYYMPRQCDALKWDMHRTVGDTAASGDLDPGYGYGQRTAFAYDSARNILWSGYRPYQMPANPNIVEYAENQAKTAALVDISGEPGNKGIQFRKLANASTSPPDSTSSGYYVNYATYGGGRVDKYTTAARFRVDEFNGADGARFVTNLPNGYDKTKPFDQRNYAPWIWVGVDRVAGQLRWQLGLDPDGGYASQVILADLGPFGAGVFNEVFLYSESALYGTQKRAVAWWNGVKVFDDYVPDVNCAWNGPEGSIGNDCGYGMFGACHISNWGGVRGGTSRATFDWFAMGRNLIQPPDATKDWDYLFTGAYLPRALDPYKTTFVTCYSHSISSSTSVWSSIVPYPGKAVVGKVVHDRANGNNPEILVHKRAPGWYWVNTMDVDPSDGKCWMAWGADQYYDYGDLGHVLTRDVAMNLGDEGVPEQGAVVAALKYSSSTMYALTCNLSTGVYSLYKAAVPPPPGPQSVGAMKSNGIGAFVHTDKPKVVTYADTISSTDFFYIEDADRGGGIRVQQPASLPAVGDKVSVSGLLAAVNGEAVVTDPVVTLASSGNPDVKPLGTNVRGTGGTELGPQPATSPAYGLNNVGLVVRIAGEVAATPADDMWTSTVSYRSWFTVEDGSGAQTKYLDIADVEQTIPGIKVLFDPGWAGAAVGDYVEVTGVVGLDFSYTYDPGTGTKTYYVPGQRIIYCRTTGDIHKYP